RRNWLGGRLGGAVEAPFGYLGAASSCRRRQPHRESAPHAELTRDIDLSSLGVDDRLAHCQTETAVASRARPPFVGAVKALEDVGQVGGRDPWPLSATITTAQPDSVWVLSRISPFGRLWWTALVKRLVMSWSKRSALTTTQAGSRRQSIAMSDSRARGQTLGQPDFETLSRTTT